MAPTQTQTQRHKKPSSFPATVAETPDCRGLGTEAPGVAWKLSLERHLGAEGGTAGSLGQAEISSPAICEL